MKKARDTLGRPMDKKRNTKLVWILMLLSVSVVWGSGFLVTDHALDSGMDPSLIMAGRFLVAAAVLFLVRAFLRPGSRKPFVKKEWILGALIGAVNFAGFFLQTAGLEYTTPERSGLLTGAYVIFVPLASGLLKKEFKLPVLTVAVCFFIGAALLTGGNANAPFNVGDAITLVSTLFFAAQILLVDRLKGVDSFNFSCAQMLAMGVLGLVFACFFSRDAICSADWAEGILPVVFLGIFSSAYAYLIQTLAQKHLSPSLTAIMLSLESLFSVVFALLVGAATFTVRLIAGGIVMCVSSTIAAVIDQVDATPDTPSGTPPEEPSERKSGEDTV